MKRSKTALTRVAAALLAALLCVPAFLALPASARAETAVVANPDPTDRLNMRQKPQSGSPILRKYYSGVEVTIISSPSKEWAKVRVGEAEGYMQRQFLKPPGSVTSAIPVGVVDVTLPQTKLALRQKESDDSTAVGSYENGADVEILGVSDGWLHVRALSDGRTGFMRSAWVAQADNLMYAAVGAKPAVLREKAQSGGKALGTYPTGTRMVCLFSFEKLEGWTRVRIGDTVGFMESSGLAFNPEPGDVPAPVTLGVKNPGTFVHLRKTASTSASSLAQVSDGERVEVLGDAGDWKHVRYGDLTGYVQTKFLQ